MTLALSLIIIAIFSIVTITGCCLLISGASQLTDNPHHGKVHFYTGLALLAPVAISAILLKGHI